MEWSNERYVRVYTRDTVTWKLLDWRARTVLLHLLRKVDRAGVLDVGDDGQLGLAAMLELPLEVIEPGIRQLTSARGDALPTVVASGSAYVLPRFLDAQEASQSDAHRKRESRARRRDQLLSASRNVPMESRFVTGIHEDIESQNVTEESRNVPRPSDFDRDRHEGSHGVTSGHSEPSPDLEPDPDPDPREPACARAIPPSTEPTPLTPTAQQHAYRRRQLLINAWALAGREFLAVQAEGIDPEAPNMWAGLPAASSPPMANLRAIVDELLVGNPPSYDGAWSTIERRVRVAAAEARRRREAQYMTPSRMWNRDSFAIASELSPEQAARGSRVGPSRGAYERRYDLRPPERPNPLRPL